MTRVSELSRKRREVRTDVAAVEFGLSSISADFLPLCFLSCPSAVGSGASDALLREFSVDPCCYDAC